MVCPRCSWRCLFPRMVTTRSGKRAAFGRGWRLAYKEYRLKKQHIKPLYDQVYALSQRFAGVKYYHHSRECEPAKKADSIAEAEYKKHHGN